jgi:predicted GIY-YIG superfamily endonuclease
MAYNTFRSIKTKGIFVYGLTDNGTIFYVGITDYVVARYQQHYSDWLICAAYIHQMRMREEYPGIVILGVFDTKREAEVAEHSIIRCLSFIGNKLCNNSQNPHENKIIINTPCTGTPKRRPQGLAVQLFTDALKDYNNFRIWEPRAIWARYR